MLYISQEDEEGSKLLIPWHPSVGESDILSNMTDIKILTVAASPAIFLNLPLVLIPVNNLQFTAQRLCLWTNAGHLEANGINRSLILPVMQKAYTFP